MTISIGMPSSGERLFLAFVQPCLDARVNESRGKTMGVGLPRFTEEKRNWYVELWWTGSAPTREMLRLDFPTPCFELKRFAAERGVTDEDMIWSHDLIAEFWRTAHKPNDPHCRIIPATVISTEYPNEVVSVLNDRGERMYVVNLLGIPIDEGDLVSVHKLIICERRV